MAAPTFVQACTGTTDATGPFQFGLVGQWSANPTVGNVVILHILQDGTGANITMSSGTNVEDLAGTDDTWTSIGTFNVGSAAVAKHHLWIGRVFTSAAALVFTGGNSAGDDVYGRIYEFTNCNTGTALSDVIENGSAGSTASAAQTSATIADVGVTTLGPDRLALNFVAGNDDNALDAFTGMSGGTWAEAVAEYADSGGTDGVIGLQTAAMASAGTIDGGTDGWADGTDGWGVVGFALIGTTVASSQSLVLPNSSRRLVRPRRPLPR